LNQIEIVQNKIELNLTNSCESLEKNLIITNKKSSPMKLGFHFVPFGFIKFRSITVVTGIAAGYEKKSVWSDFFHRKLKKKQKILKNEMKSFLNRCRNLSPMLLRSSKNLPNFGNFLSKVCGIRVKMRAVNKSIDI
jgi:hypothetical protein